MLQDTTCMDMINAFLNPKFTVHQSTRTNPYNMTGRRLNDDSDFIHLNPLNYQPKLKVFY